MRVLLALATDPSVGDALRAAGEGDDLILVEASAAAASRRLAAFKADAVVVEDTADLGLASVPLIRQSAGAVPLAILSERQDEPFLQRVREAGADLCIARPFTQAALDRLTRLVHPILDPLPSSVPAAAQNADAAAALRLHEQVAQWLTHASGKDWTVDALGCEAVRLAVQAFAAARCAFLWAEDENVRVVASEGYAKSIVTHLRLPFSRGLMRTMNQHASVVRAKDPQLDSDAQRHLEFLHGELAVPVLVDGQVLGALVLSAKAFGGPYTSGEIQLLVLIGRCVATLLHGRAPVEDEPVSSNTVLERLISRLNAGLLTVGPDRHVRLVNPSAERILARRAADLVGRDVQQLGAAFAQVAEAALGDGAPRVRQVIHDATYRSPIGLTASPLNGDGVAVLFSALPQAVAEAPAEETPFWQYLASRLAQEIKNPMVAINTYAQLLPQKFAAAEFRENFATTVQHEISRINRVVELLFAYAEEPRLHLRDVDLTGLVSSIVLESAPKWGQQGVRVVRDEEPLAVKVNGDPYFLQQAFEQLLQNAVEAMPKGGQLELRFRRRSGEAECLISNTGAVIDAEDVPRLYVPFFSTKERGMGLGLPLAQRYLKAHAGDLTLVENQPGRVSFAARLPISGGSDADAADR